MELQGKIFTTYGVRPLTY